MFERPLSSDGRTVPESESAPACFLQEVVLAPFPARPERLGVCLCPNAEATLTFLQSVGWRGLHVLFAVTDAEDAYSVPWPPPLGPCEGVLNLHAGHQPKVLKLIIEFR